VEFDFDKGKYIFGDSYYDPAIAEDVYTFNGCGKLPLKTRQRLKELGYQGEF
jgi:hypothetical protein